jgi:hypothetical protein
MLPTISLLRLLLSKIKYSIIATKVKDQVYPNDNIENDGILI